MARKMIRCFCGFTVEGEDDELVDTLTRHAQTDHQMTLTRDEVLAMAQPVAGEG